MPRVGDQEYLAIYIFSLLDVLTRYESNATRVLVGDSCLQFCGGQLGGSRTCSQQRTWVDNMPATCH